MSKGPGGYPCPYCNERKLETVATAPYVRGLLVAYQFGSKSFIGCVPCVRSKVLGEAGLSFLIGWFSVTAVIINPFLIIYNLLRGITVGENENAVKQKLTELGLPDSPNIVDVQAVCQALAASMILADGVVEESELEAAENAGDQVFGEFDEAALRMLVLNGKDLPAPDDLARMLRDTISDEHKQAIMEYLSAIAVADGHVATEEREMLERVGEGLGIVAASFEETEVGSVSTDY